jgi:hypothetical protein
MSDAIYVLLGMGVFAIGAIIFALIDRKRTPAH